MNQLVKLHSWPNPADLTIKFEQSDFSKQLSLLVSKNN